MLHNCRCTVCCMECSKGCPLISTSTALNAHLLLFVGLSLQPKACESWGRLDR